MNINTLQHEVLNKLSDSAKYSVQYYTNLFSPEHKHNHGWSVSECLDMAQRRLDTINNDIKDYKYWLDAGKNPFSIVFEYYPTEFKDAVKSMIREYYKHAYNHSKNHLIVWSSLRRVVYYKNWLDSIDSNYAVFTAKYFVYNN